MKKFTNILFAWLLAIVMCFGSAGNLAVADNAQAALSEAGEFNGVHVKATSALTDYRKIASGNFTIDVSGKALAVRLNVRTLGLENTQIEPKLVVNGAWLGANGKTVYYVPTAGSVTAYTVPWSIAFDSLFNGYIVFPADAFGTVAQGDTVSFFFGMHNEWTGLPDLDVGDIVAFDMPNDLSLGALKTAIAAGSVAYSFAGTGKDDLNSANIYEFGEDAVTFTRTYVNGEQEQTLDGYFNGLNFKIEQKLSDYARIQLPETDVLDVNGKALAIRMRKTDNEIGQIDLKPEVFGSTDWFLNETDWTLTESSFVWCLEPVKNFNGWAILTFKEGAEFKGGMWFGFADWSKNMNIDLGTIALIDLPETKDYDSFKTALETKTVVYEFATDKALNEQTSYENMPENGVSFTRVVSSYEVENKPLDGYFKGANLKIEEQLDENSYYIVSLPTVEVENITKKAFALRVNVRGGNGDIDVNLANFSLDINGATEYYTMDALGTTITEKESYWALSVDNGFDGWIIMPFAQWKGEYAGDNITLAFGSWSNRLDIDFGTAAFISMPETNDVAGFTAALESKQVICDFEPSMFGSLPKKKVTAQRVAETLNSDGAEKVPAYCSVIGDAKVMNFELGEGDLITDLVGDAGGYPISEFSTTNRGTEEAPNTALHVKLGASVENYPHSAIEVRLKGYGTKIEDTAKGLTFYVKNYQDKAFHINIGFDVGHRWYTKWSGDFASYQLYNTKTGEESVNIGGYEGLYIPANFEGYVRVSFMQFVPANWIAAIMDWEDAIANPVSYMSIDVNTDMYEGFEFDIDDIGWYYGEAQTKKMFISNSEDAKTIAQLMAEADYFAE